MNKDQFKIQIDHNRYTRGVVVTVCRIILWTLLYALFVGLTAAIFSTDIALATSSTYILEGGDIPTGAIVASIIVIILTVVYYTAVIWEIVLKIRQNRVIVEEENKYLKSGK